MPQVMITLNQIRAHDPCSEGWAKVLKANGGTKANMDKPFPVSSILDSNGLNDALWALRCLPELDFLWRKFAAWSASEVAHLMKDHRSVSAVITSWDFAEGEVGHNELAAARDAAWDAARAAARAAARDAARAAARAAARDAAWDAAWAAARAAARDAARAAARDAAWDAAWAAAWDAARDAAWDAKEKKLREILDAGEWVGDSPKPKLQTRLKELQDAK